MQRTSSTHPATRGLGEPTADYLVIGGILLVSLTLPSLRPGMTALLALASLASPSLALRALTLSWLMTVLNPGIVGDAGNSAAVRYALVLVVFGSAAFRGIWVTRGGVPRLVIRSLAFPVFAVIAAIAISPALDISLLKSISYSAGVIGVLWCSYLVNDPARLERWFMRLFLVVILASFPLIVTQVGYFRNGSGFQGILAHPQFYGAFLGVALSWMFTLRFIERERTRLTLVTLVIGIISLIASEARVGAATLIGTAVFVSLFFAPGGAQRRRARNVMLGGTTILLLLLLLFPAIGDGIYQFALKDGRGNPRDLAESLEMSRGKAIAGSFANFIKHPLIGIGFGIPSDPASLNVSYDPFLGLPTSAPIEKGFIVTGLLEETGLIGAALFAIFIAAIIRRAIWSRRASLIALAVAVPLSNIAEVTIFSLGANGLVFWVLLGYAAYGGVAARGVTIDAGDVTETAQPAPQAGRNGAHARLAARDPG